MIRNYFKIALRNLLRNKGYTLINICGLALGMASCLLILLWISDELSYDKFHDHADRLFRVEMDQKTAQGIFHVNIVPYPMGPALAEEIPEIENASRYANPGTMLIQYEEKAFFEGRARAVDPAFFRMFSFPLLKGNVETVLRDPFSIVINEDIARKYFGEEDPIGKSLIINTSYSCVVTGVMKTIPSNSTIRPEILVSIELLKRTGPYSDTWGSNQIVTWVELDPLAKASVVGPKISALYLKNIAELFPTTEEFNKYQSRAPAFKLMPLTDLRLHEVFGYGHAEGSYQSVLTFFIMAAFILLIACINFVNLATARSAKRAKEVGLRKVVGAGRNHIAFQFFSESILITLAGMLLALLLVEIFLPVLNTLSGKQLAPTALFHSNFLLLTFAVAAITGILSGAYPALFLSRFKPIQTLQGQLTLGSKSPLFRQILVIVQFSLSIILIVGTLAVYRQLQYMKAKDVGYDKDQLICLPLRGETANTYSALKQELLKDPRNLGVSGTWQPPTGMGANSGGADWDGKDPGFRPLIGVGLVDYDYVETLKIELAEGRSFSNAYATDTVNAVLVNEKVVKLMGVESAVGRRFAFNGVNDGIIIGVMKNYHYQPIQSAIEPLALYLAPRNVRYAIVRLQAGTIAPSLEQVKAAWQRVNPQYPLEYNFFDQDIARMFQDDRQMGAIFRAAAILAVIIACLGLFGLASFIIEQRTKEIGIRKTLGASVPGIAAMLTKEFAQWVLIANAISWPVAYFAMRQWLENFAYRIELSWWIFVLAGGLALGIALLTTSFQAIRAALVDPVRSLRYE